MAILQESLQNTLSSCLEEYLWRIEHLKADHLGSSSLTGRISEMLKWQLRRRNVEKKKSERSSSGSLGNKAKRPAHKSRQGWEKDFLVQERSLWQRGRVTLKPHRCVLSASPSLPRPGMKRSYPLTARVPWRLAPLLLSYAIGKSVTLIPNSRYTWYRGADWIPRVRARIARLTGTSSFFCGRDSGFSPCVW